MAYKYCWQQIVLHWISAIIIIWTTITGTSIFILDIPSSIKDALISFNISLTSLFIPFFIVRIWYFSRRGGAEKEKPTTRIGHVVHVILYINITVVLLSGILMMEKSISIFNVISIPRIITDIKITNTFSDIHIISCSTLFALILLHLMAVIKHELDGNHILHNMWL